MSHIISCRDSVYATREEAFRLLPEAGIHHVEIGGCTPDEVRTIQKDAGVRGISIATVGAGVDLAKPESVRSYERLIRAVGQAGIGRLFTSVGAHGQDDPAAFVRELSRLTTVAEKAGVIICMETHPPFGTNADVALQTMKTVGSPALRMNFDTANIYYYNQSADTLRELELVRHMVASVHLKDTDGGYHSMNFPVLGRGVVNFKRVFELLDAVKFQGPYTLELEGPLTHDKPAAERQQAVTACVQHLRAIGAMA